MSFSNLAHSGQRGHKLPQSALRDAPEVCHSADGPTRETWCTRSRRPAQFHVRLPLNDRGMDWWTRSGYDPTSSACKAEALPLSYGPVAPGDGIEPPARGASGRRSTDELSRRCLERPAGNAPASSRRQRDALVLSYGRVVGSGRNRTSCPIGTAFTAQRRPQPVLIGTSRRSAGCAEQNPPSAEPVSPAWRALLTLNPPEELFEMAEA